MLRAVQEDALGLSNQELTQPLPQESPRPNGGSVRHHTSDSQSQGYTYQGKVEAAITKRPKQLLDLPTDVLHIIIYEVSYNLITFPYKANRILAYTYE